MPTAKAKPAKDITFIDKPNEAIPTNVPITDIGIANIIIKDGLKFLRKIIKTHIANNAPMIIFCFTSEIALLM